MSKQNNSSIKIKPKPWTDDECKFLYKEHLIGVPLKDIAASIDRTVNSCSLKIRDTNWSKYGFGPIPANSSKPWSDEEIHILYRERLIGTVYKDIAKSLGRTYRSCRSKFRSINWADYSYKDETKEKIRKAKSFSANQYTIQTVEDKLEKFRIRSDVIADKLSQSMDRMPIAPLRTWAPSRKGRKGSPEDMGLMFSDLHVGQENKAEELDGIGEYSLEVFRRRMKNLEDAVSDIYELHSNLYKIPNLHVFCLGDIVHGMNAVGQWGYLHVDTPIYDQVLIAVNAISETIFYWLTIFDNVKFYCVRGNHGRIAASGLEKDFNNWDNIIYTMLSMRFENNHRISFDFSKSWWIQREIRSHNFLLIHGDDVKSKDGLPIKGLMDYANRMSGLTKIIPDYTLAGHFHNAAELESHRGEVLINGAFVGADAYSIKNAMPGTRAIQKIFGIHNEHGITWRYNINLDNERNSRK